MSRWLFQGPDLPLGQLLKMVEECCPQTAYAVKIRLEIRSFDVPVGFMYLSLFTTSL